jgi:uncharacterized protein (DUF2252 family)
VSLSLASAARGSDLPGLTTVKMLERIMDDYHRPFAHNFDEKRDIEEPEPIRRSSIRDRPLGADAQDQDAEVGQ